jgi:tetratricopeptide (TPR) repeat protein
MIVTSREHFTLPGMLAHDLAVLSVDEARDLLLKIEPRISETADKIAKLCGYLPKALRAVASILVNAPNLSPTDLLCQMSDAQRRLSVTGVELALATSSELLSSDLRDHWFQLSVFQTTFDEAAAAAIWGTSNDDSKRRLSSLLRYSLVEFDSTHRRFYLHDLVRDFTLSRLDKSSAALARFRHAVHFLDILAGASFLYRRGEAGITLGLGMFDVERLNIEAGQRWATNHAPASKDAARLCLEYSDAGTTFLKLRFTQREQVAWLTTGIQSVSRLMRLSWHRRQVFEAEVRLLTELTDVLLARGQFKEAIQPIIKSIERLEDLHLEHSALRQLISLGDILRISGQRKAALQVHSFVYQELFEYDDMIHNVSLMSIPGGRVTDVFRYLTSINRGELRSPISLGIIAAGSLGKDWLVLRKPHRAMTYFSMQLDLATKSGDLHNQAFALSHLGIAYDLLGYYRRAIEFHDKSRIIAERLRDKDSEANFLFNTARAYIGLEDRVAAISTADNALKLYEETDSRHAEEVRSALQEWSNLKSTKLLHGSSPGPRAEVSSPKISPGKPILMKADRSLLRKLIASLTHGEVSITFK